MPLHFSCSKTLHWTSSVLPRNSTAGHYWVGGWPLFTFSGDGSISGIHPLRSDNVTCPDNVASTDPGHLFQHNPPTLGFWQSGNLIDRQRGRRWQINIQIQKIEKLEIQVRIVEIRYTWGRRTQLWLSSLGWNQTSLIQALFHIEKLTQFSCIYRYIKHLRM